jgi:Ran GTPase-activating protein (RanGAP) involved in mRNA processing and transport
LQKYSNITDLELKGNNIGGAGLTALSNVLRSSYTLRSISLEWNKIGTSETGLQNLFLALTDNRSITKVDLRNNEIGPEVGTLIATCLKSNSTLQFIDLRWNRLGNTGAKAILKGLNVNKII